MNEKQKSADAKPVLNIRTGTPPGVVKLSNEKDVRPPAHPPKADRK